MVRVPGSVVDGLCEHRIREAADGVEDGREVVRYERLQTVTSRWYGTTAEPVAAKSSSAASLRTPAATVAPAAASASTRPRGERIDQAPSDPAAGTGDQRDLAVETEAG